MAFSVPATVDIGLDFAYIRVLDNFNYTDPTSYTVTVYQYKIVPPGGTSEITIDLLADLYTGHTNDNDTRQSLIYPSDLSLGSAFTEGIYQGRITMTVNSTQYVAYKNFAIIPTLKTCMNGKITNLAILTLNGEQGCSDCKKTLENMYLQYDSIQYDLVCNRVQEASDKYNILLEYCQNCEEC